jgi:hypothetical protein
MSVDDSLVVARPGVSIGTAQEYSEWVKRLREAAVSRGGSPDSIEQINARYNYRANQITLYRLPDSTNPLSISETLSHEFLHALLYWTGERMAARLIDIVGLPAGTSERTGGI